MHEEFALRQPNDLANQWADSPDAGDAPTLAQVARDPDGIGAVNRPTVSAGEVTAEAYERHSSEIHGFVLRIVRDPDEAADLVADTFAKLLTEERAGRTPLQVRPWLYRVASNLSASRGRRIQATVRRTLGLERQGPPEPVQSPERAVLDRERDGDLWRALGLVSRDERTALLLAALGYDGAMIAAMVGRSQGATRTLMCRARRRLRNALQEDEA